MLPAFGLYTQIAANRRRSAFLLAGLFVLFYLMTFALALLMRTWDSLAVGAVDDLVRTAARDTLWFAPFVTVAVGLWVWIGLRFNEILITGLLGATTITRAENPKLYNLLENLCISRGLGIPKLRILETTNLNAFAAGVRPDQYSVTLTRGLVDTLNERELEAVIAHELTHIRNGDVRMMIIAVFVVGVMSFAGEMIFRSVTGRAVQASETNTKNSGRGAAVAIALFCIVIAWMLSLVIRFTLSRQREYLADAGAVELTHNPDAMIAALLKIAERSDIEKAPSSVMEMCLDNPRSTFMDLFATHPSIERRIDALIRMGGRRPEIHDAEVTRSA